MPEALRLLPFLLVPVLALLFLNLRLSRKLRYPHDLLAAEERRGLASFLFRNLRTYYDVLLDALIAVILAFALWPPRMQRPAAVVIDGSRAMLAGFAEDRPILKALKRIRTDPGLKGAEPFLLAFDPKTSATKVLPIGAFLKDLDAEEAIRRLRGGFDFASPDDAALAELRQRGYGDITLLTDQLRVRPVGFRAIELGFAVTFAVYPTAVRFDRAAESWLVALAEAGPRASLTVSRWDPATEAFTRLPSGRYAVEDGAAGRLVRFSAPGLYLLSFRGPYGLDDIDLPLRLPERAIEASAAGPFSERMLSIFPDVERSGRPGRVLRDQTVPGTSDALVTALVPGPEHGVLDPARTGGSLIAADSLPGVELALGPASRANEDLVLAYESRLSDRPESFLNAPPPGVEETRPLGTAHLARKAGAWIPVIPPASQSFERRPGQTLVLPPPTSPRWPWGLALGALAALKLVLWKRFTGKPVLARG